MNRPKWKTLFGWHHTEDWLIIQRYAEVIRQTSADSIRIGRGVPSDAEVRHLQWKYEYKRLLSKIVLLTIKSFSNIKAMINRIMTHVHAFIVDLLLYNEEEEKECDSDSFSCTFYGWTFSLMKKRMSIMVLIKLTRCPQWRIFPLQRFVLRSSTLSAPNINWS